jgi:hypothetical protein
MRIGAVDTRAVASRKTIIIISAFVAICAAELCAEILFANHTTPSKAKATKAKDKPSVININKAAICAIQKGGLKYIDEWVDYHMAIGFDTIFLYDNSDNFELQGWRYSERFLQGNTSGTEPERFQIKIIHWPGKSQQLPTYNNCTNEIQNKKHNRHAWIAFIDVDEFFVIKDTKKYPFIMDVLDTIPSKAGGLAVSWQGFGWNNQTKYEAKPLTMRFTKRYKNHRMNRHVKVIARSDALKDIGPTPHVARYKTKPYVGGNYETLDTNGETVKGPFNERIPTDVLVLHHYHSKSIEEYRWRCARGRADIATAFTETYPACWSEEELLANWTKDEANGDQKFDFDDSAWMLLKERAPTYTRFEA